MSKWTWLLAALVAALLISMVWLLRGGDDDKPAKRIGPDAGVKTTRAPDTQRPSRPKVVRRGETPVANEDEPVKMIDPKSEKFSDRIDVGIPFRLRSELAWCYKGGLDPDLTVKIRYRLHIKKGQVTTTDVEAISSEVDRKLRNCFLEKVRNASWELRDMPDFTEENELFVRLRTLKKYKDRAEMFAEDEK